MMTAPTARPPRRRRVTRPELSPTSRWRCETHREKHTLLVTRTLPNADGTRSVIEGFRYACRCERWTVVGRVITAAELQAIEDRISAEEGTN